jgi:hypothetical protein
MMGSRGLIFICKCDIQAIKERWSILNVDMSMEWIYERAIYVVGRVGTEFDVLHKFYNGPKSIVITRI